MSELEVFEICKFISEKAGVDLSLLIDSTTKELTKFGALSVVAFLVGFTQHFMKKLSEMKGSE